MTAQIQSHGAYAIPDMEAAFDKVSNPDDWRAPIDALVPGSEIGVTEAAITFFTGTVPTVRAHIKVDPATHLLCGRGFRVKSVGYRNGPCGP